MAQKLLIEINDGIKVFNPGKKNETKVLNGINLKVYKGDSISIMGVSGSGKTTLLNVIATIDHLSDGTYKLNNEIDVDALEDSKLAELRSSTFGYILQDYSLLNNDKVYDNVILPLSFSKKYRSTKDRKKRVQDVVESVGLTSKLKEKVKNLSGGERQRVAIARAIINDPDIILADEPTGALDSITKEEIMDIINALNKAGKTIIMVTHDIEVASRLKKLIYIRDGVLKKESKIKK